jgi:hypothetical protein
MSEPLIMRRARQREQLILALLQQPGMEKAAASIGISGVTAWRITKTPEFQEEYRLAPRRSPKVTHLYSDRVAHTKNSVSRSFGRVGGIGGRDSNIIRAAFLARGKTIVFIKMRVAVAICPRAARSEPEIGTLHQLPT